MLNEQAPPGFELVACALCGGRDLERRRAAEYHLNLLPPIGVRRCRACSMQFLSPRPDKQLRSSLMAGEVPHELRPYSEKPANYGAVNRSRAAIFDERAALLERLHGGTGRLLDVGASAGALVMAARRRGFAAHGVEPSAGTARGALEHGVAMPRAVGEAIPFADGVFDVVHSHHVVEHLADPAAAMREMFRLLAPGGLVFIEVPNQFDNLSFRRDELLSRVHQRERNLRSIHHLWFFSTATLERLLRQVGFVDVRVDNVVAAPRRGWRLPASLAMRTLERLTRRGPILRGHGRKPGGAGGR